MKLVAILAVLACGFSQIVSASDKVVICYLGTWSRYRSGNGQYLLSDIDTTLCTHLVYAFVGLSTNGSVGTLDSWLDYNLDNLNAFNALKTSNPNLKTLLAVGGWNEGSTKYSTVACDATLRSTFVQSALSWVQTYGFDGFDLDWEYPAQRGGASTDKDNFSLLLKEFREVFDQHGLLLTAAVAASCSSADTSYNISALSEYLDYINIMAYDLHGSYDGVTGHNAPLYASSIDTTAATQELNIEKIITGWIERGASPSKIALGLPAYGRSFTLSDSSNVALGAACSGAGTAGPYTAEAGMLGYNEIVEKLAGGDWTVVWDDEQKVPHAYCGDQWVGYDNAESIKYKVEFAIEKGLGGLMLWSLETEDFKGIGGTTYPLLNAVKDALAADNSSSVTTTTTTTTAAPTTTTTTAATATTTTTTTAKSTAAATTTTTTAAPATTTTTTATTAAAVASSDTKDDTYDTWITCTSQGYVRAPKNCCIFYNCNEVGALAVAQSCPSGLYFDLSVYACNWASLVSC